MKKQWLTILFCLFVSHVMAQSIIFHNLKDFVANEGDTIETPRELTVEKRTKAQILMHSGGDYKISANRVVLREGLKKRYFAVRVDSNLYVNCRKLKIKKFRFGKFYAPAIAINSKIYFCAVPVGPATLTVVDRNIGMGVVGEAIAASSATERVYYQIDTETGVVEFMGKENMCILLDDYPELKAAYLLENSEEAHVTGKYLQQLKAMH